MMIPRKDQTLMLCANLVYSCLSKCGVPISVMNNLMFLINLEVPLWLIDMVLLKLYSNESGSSSC